MKKIYFKKKHPVKHIDGYTYVLSEEDFKKDEWIHAISFNPTRDRPYQHIFQAPHYNARTGGAIFSYSGARRIIATDDYALIVEGVYGMPEYYQQEASTYKGEDEIWLEYEDDSEITWEALKLTDNNEVIISNMAIIERESGAEHIKSDNFLCARPDCTFNVDNKCCGMCEFFGGNIPDPISEDFDHPMHDDIEKQVTDILSNTSFNKQVAIERIVDYTKSLVDIKTILFELLDSSEEVLMSPRRFQGVSEEKIKQVFEKHGVKYEDPF